MKRLPILLSLLTLILLSASIAYWVLLLYQPPQRPLAVTPLAAQSEPSVDAAATLFGGQAAAATVTNYHLTGIVAAGRDSVAIIVAEGSPPKALKIGKEIAPGVTVSEVYPRYVMLSDGGVMKRIELAVDTKPAVPLSGAAPAAMHAAPGATVPEPPMSPGPVQGQTPDNAAFSGGARDEPPQPANQAQPANQPAPATQAAPAAPAAPPPAPVQMPPPTRSPGSPVNQPPATR
jgi:general secretion pathway protein C